MKRKRGHAMGSSQEQRNRIFVLAKAMLDKDLRRMAGGHGSGGGDVYISALHDFAKVEGDHELASILEDMVHVLWEAETD